MDFLKRMGIFFLLFMICMKPASASQKERGYYKYISESYGAHAMGLEWVKSQLADRKNLRKVKVAVFDTSILKTHDVFRGRKVKNQLGLSKGSHFHGTAVAGVIADCTPANVHIYGYQVNIREPETLKKALNAAINDNVDIITMCIGHKKIVADQEIEDLLKKAFQKNIILLAAAANNKENGKNVFPANSNYTYAVSALSADPSRHDVIEDMSFANAYSNYGNIITFCGPGTGVLIPREGNPHKFLESKGTSFATPHIAACFAYLKMFYPRKNNQSLVEILKKFCVDKGRAGCDPFYGWGVPDMAEFYQCYTGKKVKNLAVIKKVKKKKMSKVSKGGGKTGGVKNSGKTKETPTVKKTGKTAGTTTSKKKDTSKTSKKSGTSRKLKKVKSCQREIVFNLVPRATYKLYRRPLTKATKGWERIMTLSSRKMKKGLYRFTDKTAREDLRYEYLLYMREKDNNYISRYALD